MAFDYVTIICKNKQEEFTASGFDICYKNFTSEEVMLPMSDGICLWTWIFKPDRADSNCKTFPVILQRTCYPNQNPLFAVYGEHLAKRGYVFVLQISRGMGLSEGNWAPNINERQDGMDTVHWLSTQSWAGPIGYYGLSYASLCGWSMADAIDEKITSMCLQHYGCDRFLSAYEKGSFRHDILTGWSIANAGFPITADYLESSKYMPHINVDKNLWGQEIPWYRDYISNSDITDPYWQQNFWIQLREIPSKTTIPLYVTSGWYDHHHGSTMATWSRLNAASKEHSWLDIGGWNHFFLPILEDRETKNIDNNEVRKMLEWFDLTLKQGKKPAKRVSYYKLCEGTWKTCKSWEGLDRTEQVFYMDTASKGFLECRDDSSDLSSCKDGCSKYTYDPATPIMTHGGETLLTTTSEIGSKKQPKPGYRDDLLSFVSKSLDKNLRINGKIQVELYVSSDCEDTAFTAKIMEVLPDGQSYNIRSSITTLAADCESYEPENVVKVLIDMYDIAYTLTAGSKLRIDIASSDFPQYHIHCNYAGAWAEQAESRTAHQKVYTGEKYPSRIILPCEK